MARLAARGRLYGWTQVALAATGRYGKPVHTILEGSCALLVVNAAHRRALPGRQTAVRDAAWIATLLKHGLLRASFIPHREQREVRALTRTRTSLIDERAAAVKRIQKIRADAPIKVAGVGVVTDIMGTAGRNILAAVLEGTMEAAALADLARGTLRRKRAALEHALEGRRGGGAPTTAG